MNYNDDYFKNNFTKNSPLLTTSIVAAMLEITPDRLRTYDAEKLILTHRIKTGEVQKRLYSQSDVEWLRGIRLLIKKHKMTITAVKYILKLFAENKSINLPRNEISDILSALYLNPNFNDVVKNF